jgi:ATP-binding cassette subfamily F protein 3
VLANINIKKKSFFKNLLFENLNLSLKENEKIALIGRNGFGKSTLFKLLTGEDKIFEGTVELKSGIRVIMTQQEHHFDDKMTVLDYILGSVTEYPELKKIMDKAEVSDEYLDAITKFTDYGYFTIEDDIIIALKEFQLSEDKALMPMSSLSGGEKRFVELVKVMFSNADLALFDEPTNHMDYEGKQAFINWLKNTKQSLVVITHDRDVLHCVDKIIELKDRKISEYAGNYERYTNSSSLGTVADIHKYETDLQRLKQAKQQFEEAKVAKLSAKSMKGRDQAKTREERFKKQLEDLEASIVKPSFWIDQESLSNVSEEVQEKYNKYKNKNISIKFKSEVQHGKLLLQVSNFALGYDKQLFKPLNFELFQGDRIRLKGRNGAGKTTFLNYIQNQISDRKQVSNVFSGYLKTTQGGKLGVYRQEIEQEYLRETLSSAIIKVYKENGKIISIKDVMSIMSQYLFKNNAHADTPIGELSGGEKARFQIIKMLANDPNLLILDEPTNHLDLPSIEVLETFIKSFHGSIIYVSHDSYFVNNLESKEIEIEKFGG